MLKMSHTAEAAKETEAHTSEQHARESIRIARVTRELLKKFAAAYRAFQAGEPANRAGIQCRGQF